MMVSINVIYLERGPLNISKLCFTFFISFSKIDRILLPIYSLLIIFSYIQIMKWNIMYVTVIIIVVVVVTMFFKYLIKNIVIIRIIDIIVVIISVVIVLCVIIIIINKFYIKNIVMYHQSLNYIFQF